MAFTVRAVEDSDIAAMAAIRAREWGTEIFWKDRIRLYLSGEHSPKQALAARAVFVAVEGTTLVGFVAAHRTRRLGCDGELQWMNVAEEKRGLGVADELMAKISAWFVEHSIHRVCVNVEATNTVALKLYGRWAARRLNEHWMIWEDAPARATPANP